MPLRERLLRWGGVYPARPCDTTTRSVAPTRAQITRLLAVPHDAHREGINLRL